MIKRTISILLALAVFLTVVPLSAVADGIETLTFLKVRIDEPMAGREASFDAGVGALPTNAARVYVEQKDNRNYRHGVGWYDHTDARYLEEGECFTEGHEYTVHVAVCVDNYFYQLSGSLEATVNGEAASVSHDFVTKTVVSYHFGVCKTPPPDVTEVTLGGNLRPVAGKSPVFTLAYDSERMEPDLYAGTAFIDGVAWYNSDTFMILDENDTFQAGNTYTMTVKLKAKGNYRFATQNGESVVKSTIEGVSATNISSQTDDPSRYLKLQVEFACAATDTLGGGAGSIDLRIPYPVSGKTMSFAPTLYGAHCEISPVMSDGFYEGVKWTNRRHAYTFPHDSVFNAGIEYSVTVVVKAESIMQDEKRLRYILHEDGSVDPYITATVNGMPARVEPYKDDSVAQAVQVTFDFPSCNETSLTVDTITFTDVRTPVVGQKIDTMATVVFDYAENAVSSKKVVELQWYKQSADSEALTEEDVFEAGYGYFWVAGLTTDAVSEFLVEDKRYSGNLIVRGAKEAMAETDPGVSPQKKLMVGAVYVPLESLPDPIGQVDIIGAVAPTIGQHPCYSAALAQAVMPYAEIGNVCWYENGNVMMESNATFKKGNSYSVLYEVKAIEPYTFAQNADGSVNGDTTLYDGNVGLCVNVSGDRQTATVQWDYGELKEASYSGVTDYVEISELVRPAPGQTPDFTVSIDSSYTQFGGVTWYALDDNGYRMKALTPQDRFKKNTIYRVEICVLPSAGRSINLDSRGAVLNGKFEHYYYLSGEAVMVYAEYDTRLCITEFDVIDVQYPLPGKTPDTTAIPIIHGEEADRMHMVENDNGSDIDWYTENSSGTSFSRLDGRFTADRRHQAWMTVETVDGAWFATDNKGNLTVDICVDGVPADYAYATDAYVADGMVNKLELGCTYRISKDVDGVFVDGKRLTDGLYLENGCRSIQTEDTVNKEVGYAYYEDGVLTLHNFEWETHGDYDAVFSHKPLTVKAEGENHVTSHSKGINAYNTLTMTGDGSLELLSNQYGIFAMDEVTVNSGRWRICDTMYDGLWLYMDLTMNGGTLEISGDDGGIYGDDWPTIHVNDGTLIAKSETGYAIGWCNVKTADGITVTVDTDTDGENTALWDGETDFMDYAYVRMDSKAVVMKGDVDQNGTVNMRDAMVLYQFVSGAKDDLASEQLAAGEVDGNTTLNMRDVMKLYQFVSGAVDSL